LRKPQNPNCFSSKKSYRGVRTKPNDFNNKLVNCCRK